MKYAMPFVGGCHLTMAGYFISFGDFTGAALALACSGLTIVYSIVEWSHP